MTYTTFMEAWRAASVEYRETGETLMIDETRDGLFYLRPRTAAEEQRSRENLRGLWNAELDRHTPANGGRS